MEDKIHTQKEYYNRRWESPSFLNPLEFKRGLTIFELMWHLIWQLGLNRPRILDLGRGKGWFTTILAKIGPTVGIDLSDVAITEAKKSYPDARFICRNIFFMVVRMRENLISL